MFERLLQDFIWLSVGILSGWMLLLVLQASFRQNWIPATWRCLPRGTKVVLLVLVGAAVWRGVPKTTNGVGRVSAPLLNASLSLTGNSLGSAGTGSDPARFTAIDVATNGTVSLLAYRPPDAATLAQNIVVVATTNLCTPTWFALTNMTFAAGETNMSVTLSREFLASCAITTLGIFSFCGIGDSDGDGLADWEERFQTYTNPYSRDTDRDGDDDRWEVALGFDPCRDELGIQLTNAIARTANYDLLFGFSGSSLTVTNSTGTVVTPVEQSLSPAIGQNELPQLADDGLDPFGFTWTDCFTPSAAGVYTFTVEADDVALLSIAGSSAYTSWWIHQDYDPQSVSVGLKAGVSYPISVTYANFGGPALLSITTSFVGDPGYNPGLEVTPYVVHIGPSGDAEEDWPVAAITGTTNPDVAYSIQVEMTEGLVYDESAQCVMPDRSGSFWTDGATATAVFRLYGDGDEIASDQCVFVYSAPKEPERSCGCGGYGTEVENGCVHFAQPFGATPGVPGLPTGRVVVRVSEPSTALYTPAVLRYDHPMMRRMIYRRNLDAIIADALGNVTEYRRGLPSGISTGLRGQLFRRADGAFVEELADGLRVVYSADGTVSALQPEHAAPIVVADLGIAVSTNALGWVTNVASLADGQMATTVSSVNAWRLTWFAPNGSIAKTFDFGGDGATTFTLTEQRGDGAFAFNHRWTYAADARDWLLEKGANSAEEVRTVRTKVYDATNRVWRITQSKTDAAGTVLACESSVLDRNGHAPRVTERSDGVTGQCLYAAALDAFGRVVCETNALGAVTSYAYDAFGRVTQKTVVAAGVPTETTSFGYSADIAPIDFRPVWKRTSADGQPLLEESFADVANADGTTTRTHTRTAAGTTRTSCEVFDALGRTILVIAEDGRATQTVYENLVDGGWTTTEDAGIADESDFALVPDRSTREVRRYSAQGNLIRRERYALVDESWHLLDSSEMNYDAAHRRTSSAFSDGTTESAGWICSGPVWTRGRDGVLVTNLYDAAKQKCASIRRGPFGDVRTAYTRDGAGRVVAETTTAANCETQMVTRVYDSRGRVTSETTANGSTTAMAYSADDRVTTITNADGGTEVTALNADGSFASVTGTAVTPEFTAYGVETITVNGVATTCRTKTVRTGSANSPRFEKTFVNGFGETMRVERSGFNGAVLVTENVYDACGHLIVTTETGKPSVSFAYDVLGICTNTTRTADGVSRMTERETQFVVPSNVVWRASRKISRTSDTSIAPLVTESYDRMSGLTTNRIAESFTVDVRGNTNRTWSALDIASARTTRWASNAAYTNLSFEVSVDGLPVQTVNAACVTNTVAYDAFRRRVSETDGRGNTSTFVYDAYGHLVSQTDAATNTTYYAYDSMDRVTAITNALGGVTTRTYDTRGNLLSEGGATYPVNYGYDIYGNRTSLTTFRDESSGTGDTTTWLYDEASGLVTNKVYADGHGPTYTYDANGRMLQRTWARGVVTTCAYDAWGNLSNTVYSDGTPSVALTYDSLGRKTRVVEAAGTTLFAYDDYGSQTNETWCGLGSRMVTHHWDEYGRDSGYSVNGMRKTTLGYDMSTGRLVSMDADGNFVWQYLDGSELKSKVTYPNGVTVDYTYESCRDLLTGVTNHLGNTVYSSYAYENDALGRHTLRNGEQYGYNTRNELTSATGSGAYIYEYDDIGNRKSSTEPGDSLTYVANQLNQYASVSNAIDGTFQPAFDADGNQTLVKTSTGSWSVTYNGENRPVCWSNGTTVVTMDFDSMGRRTFYRETVNGVQTVFSRFFYNGYLMIQQLDSNPHYNVCKEFIWDPTELVATKPLCFRQDGETDTFLTHDGNKNVTDLIRVSPYNDSVGHYDYAPFGAVRSQTGGRAATNPFRFSSEFSDDSLCLVYYNYRHYNPWIGRWMSYDRIESFTGYLFVENCVVGQTDRIGLEATSEVQTSSAKGRDCTYLVYVAHGVSDPKGNLWDKLKSRTYPTCPTGDRYGYWGCGANVFNEMTKNDHPGFELPVELPSGYLVDEITQRDLVRRGIPEKYARKYRSIAEDVNTTLVATVEKLKSFAKASGDLQCRCKSVSIKIECSENMRNAEVFYMLGEATRDKLENEARSNTGAHKLAYDRYYEAYREKLKCGTTIKVE